MFVVFIFHAALIAILLWIAFKLADYRRRRSINICPVLDNAYVIDRKNNHLDRTVFPYAFPGVGSRNLVDKHYFKNMKIPAGMFKNINTVTVKEFTTPEGAIAYELFNDLKNFSSPISLKFFDPVYAEKDSDLPSALDWQQKAKNVLSAVQMADFLTPHECYAIIHVLRRIAIFNSTEVEPNRSELKSQFEWSRDCTDASFKQITENTFLSPKNLKHLLFFYNALATGLGIKFNIYFSIDEEEMKLQEFSCENPTKNLSFLIREASLSSLKE